MRALSWSCRLVTSVVVGVWILASTVSAGAQATREEPRTALVIGNGAYRDTPLRNAVNDVRAVAKTLRELGFTVLAHENTTKRTMETAVIEFGRRLAIVLAHRGSGRQRDRQRHDRRPGGAGTGR